MNLEEPDTITAPGRALSRSPARRERPGHGLMLALCVATACMGMPMPAQAQAQAWTPAKPIRLIVPYGPGGSSDVIARAIAAEMSRGLGQQVIVDNKGGGQGIVAMQDAARAAPDGYTMVLGHVGTLAVNPAMLPRLPYDPGKDYAPVTLLAKVPMVFAVGPSVNARSLPAFVSLAKAKPGKLTYGSAGNGSAGHLAFEMLKVTVHADLLHVPYKGTGAQMTDLLAGNIDAAAAGLPGFLPHVKAGRLRILAVGAAQRLPTIPDVPTVAEQGYPGFESSQWFGLLVPAKTPTVVVERLHAEAVKALNSPAVRHRLAEDSSAPMGQGPEDFARFIQAERNRWGAVVRSANVRAD
ncbi:MULTISPECIES: tripartite tricarboxylate transporter substrate binding protein [unclassified Cupriavidus]|uniref:Bug family tripartite tricarboxylate transporter substrate binding protein n=1 Tax=unclassified Cupriavidus TaxID=2640874 RepID=UPI00295EC0FA|nr:tripartite tricarboxylate transporter substrate binding protein [Cupriavidus sp. TA19]